jgi:Domain of unknown function (DUF4252)
MKTTYFLIPVILILSATTFLGCIGVDNDFREVKSLVMKSANDKFYKDVEFSVGPLGISFAKFIVSINDDDEDAEVILSNISEVQVGVYKKKNWNQHYDYSFFRDIDNKLKDDNWQFVVRHVDGDELTGIYVKYDDDFVNKMFVININDDKLSLVRVEGDLENIITYAIKDKGFDRVSFR